MRGRRRGCLGSSRVIHRASRCAVVSLGAPDAQALAMQESQMLEQRTHWAEVGAAWARRILRHVRESVRPRCNGCCEGQTGGEQAFVLSVRLGILPCVPPRRREGLLQGVPQIL